MMGCDMGSRIDDVLCLVAGLLECAGLFDGVCSVGESAAVRGFDFVCTRIERVARECICVGLW